MQQLISALQQAGIGRLLLNEPLAPYTTWKIGGPADLLIVPDSKEQLVKAVSVLHSFETPWMSLGRGSNLLVGDGGVRGAVIKLGKGLETLSFDGRIVRAGGAYGMIKLSVMAAKEGLTGLEFAGGIPGSVGGAVFMNAGAHGSDMSRILISAEVLQENGELARLEPEQLQFAYRSSVLHGMRAIVTEAEFELEYGDRKEIAAAMATYKDRRLRTQPFASACAGSVFRNPQGDFAARLIEASGLKGLRIGGAEVSEQHANFIVNTGGATAKDVLALIERIQAVVLEQHGVKLIREVLAVGER